MQRTFGYQTGKAPDQVAKTASATSTASRNLTGTGALGTSAAKPAPTPAAKPAPTPVNRATGSRKPGSVYSGFDMFDLVKGHLLDEGYADTEEAAIAIMANMSEEWREGIVEMMGGAGGMGRMNFSMSRSSGASPRPSGTSTSNRPNTRPTNTNNTSKERIKFSNPLFSRPSSTIR
jgi:hypothetical protein